MPAALADSGKCGFAQAHFEFVAENEADDQLFAVAFGTFAAGHGRRKNVGRVRRVLLPVDVVVVHAADHQGVGEGRGDGVNFLPGADDGGGAASRDFFQDFERDDDVVLLVATQGAADGVEQEALRLIDRVL